MMLAPKLSAHFELPMAGHTLPMGWPAPKTWDGLKVFHFSESQDFFYILTDGTRSKVFVLTGDT